MGLREATLNDIKEMQRIRNAVKENVLSDPALVKDEDVADYISKRGKGWVVEENDYLLGFAIVSLADKNVWALFMHPEAERKGMGRLLHETMINWYFSQTSETVWLSTAPGTRAENFYRKAGWAAAGSYGKGELKFEMSAEKWQLLHSAG